MIACALHIKFTNAIPCKNKKSYSSLRMFVQPDFHASMESVYKNICVNCNQKAGDGNRTHVSSLEGWCSTIELHPQKNKIKKRQTGLEPATSTLARWRTTNCTTVACSGIEPATKIIIGHVFLFVNSFSKNIYKIFFTNIFYTIFSTAPPAAPCRFPPVHKCAASRFPSPSFLPGWRSRPPSW